MRQRQSNHRARRAIDAAAGLTGVAAIAALHQQPTLAIVVASLAAAAVLLVLRHLVSREQP